MLGRGKKKTKKKAEVIEAPSLEDEEEELEEYDPTSEFEENEDEEDLPPMPTPKKKVANKAQAKPEEPTVATPAEYLDVLQGQVRRLAITLQEFREVYKL